MTRQERKRFESLQSPYNKYWIPCVWFANLAAVARCEGRIKDNNTYKLLMEVIISIVYSYNMITHDSSHYYTLRLFVLRDIEA